MAEAPQNGPQQQVSHDKDNAETYTPAEAGRILGLSDERIRQMVEAGELKGEKRGGRWRVDRRAVHDLLDKRGSPRTKKASQRREDRSQEADTLRVRIEHLQRELGRLEGRLELTEQTESTLREQLKREQERADRLEEELRQEKRRSWWSRLFGTGE